jgi:ubiquitin C-terminal hydrolase
MVTVHIPETVDQTVLSISVLLSSVFKQREIEKPCENCGATTATQYKGLVVLPHVLGIHLQRAKYSVDTQTSSISTAEVNVLETLQLNQFLYNQSGDLQLSSAVNPSDTEYHLSGIIRHVGSSLDSGYYVFYVLNLSETGWTRYDDADVKTIELADEEANGGRRNSYLLMFTTNRAMT